jgi:hypothetical protein
VVPPSPPPKSRRADSSASDDSWDSLIDGAFAEPDPVSGTDVFERPTTVPTAPPPDAAEFTFDVKSQRLPDDLPPTRRGSNDDIPAVLAPRPSPSTAPQMPPDPFQTSPLDLVETYRHATGAMPRAEFSSRSDGATVREPETGSAFDMKDRYAVGDYTGALVIAESILDQNPDDEDARRYAQSCREVLTQMYAARIGPMDQVAIVAVPTDQITWLSLDHRAGFLLSLIDGVSSIDEILDISGMTRLDALRIMFTLVQQNVITLDPR